MKKSNFSSLHICKYAHARVSFCQAMTRQESPAQPCHHLQMHRIFTRYKITGSNKCAISFFSIRHLREAPGGTKEQYRDHGSRSLETDRFSAKSANCFHFKSFDLYSFTIWRLFLSSFSFFVLRISLRKTRTHPDWSAQRLSRASRSSAKQSDAAFTDPSI